MNEDRIYTDILFKRANEEFGTSYPSAQFNPKGKILTVFEHQIKVKQGDTVYSRWTPGYMKGKRLRAIALGRTGGDNFDNKFWDEIETNWKQRRNLKYFSSDFEPHIFLDEDEHEGTN